MTGMGKAHRRRPGISIEVELRSVNNKFLVIRSHLQDALLPAEQRLHDLIRKQLKRGTVDLFVKMKTDGVSQSSRINRKVLDAYLEAVKRSRKRHHLEGAAVPELLLGLPGVLEIDEKARISMVTIKLIEETANEALERLVKMRATEGERLVRGIQKRRRLLEKFLLAVESRSGKHTKERVQRLKVRIRDLLDGEKLSSEDPTLQREIAFLADRADITEEVDRFKSHLAQFDRITSGNGEIGRQLDFLIQEMGREVNTMGSKACSAAVSHDVVRMKAELEKIREQVQNIE
jgi:uncharacterized protein (TIGR00255 family)